LSGAHLARRFFGSAKVRQDAGQDNRLKGGVTFKNFTGKALLRPFSFFYKRPQNLCGRGVCRDE
jgi:hypothetical protein